MIKPYPEQIEAVEAAFKAGRGTIEACTGFGKSLVMMLLVQRFQMRTLIVCPNLALKTQLRATFLKHFGSLENITIENVDSTNLRSATNYDLLIIDESHHVAASTFRKLNVRAWKGIFHRFFFTGTPYRNREEEQLLMESISGEIIYSVPYSVAVAKNYVVPVEAYFYSLPPTKTSAETWAGVYRSLVVANEYRNKVIAHLMHSLHSAQKSTLVLVKEVAHGKALSALTGAAFAHGDGEDCQQLIQWFAGGRLKSLIATEGTCAEGVDSRAAEYVIIAGLGKSKPAFLQKVGRGVRKFPGKESAKVILFKDKSHRWCASHYAAQAKYLRDEFSAIPIPLPLPEDLV